MGSSSKQFEINANDPFLLAFRQAFLASLAAFPLTLRNDEPVLVAFSGGPDSTALVLALALLAPELKLAPLAFHVNHGLRAEESQRDESFCHSLAERLGLTFRSCALQAEDKSEAGLRKARYDKIENLAAEHEIRICLTGHTLDDQVETMLFRLFRGTGPAGLLGIPASRRLNAGLIILRPLLGFAREDCLSFLARAGVEPCHDSTNNNDEYTRNFIRNQVLPLLATRFPAYRRHMEQLRGLLEADESLLSCLTDDALQNLCAQSGSADLWHLDLFSELPLSLRRKVVHESLKRREIEFDFARIDSLLELIDEDGESSTCLSEKWRVKIGAGCLRWESLLDNQGLLEDQKDEILCVPLNSEGLTLIHKLGLAAKTEELSQNSAHIEFPGSQDYMLVGDLRACGELKFRLRESGDRIHPLGMSCSVRLKKFLHTHKSTKTLSFGGRVLVLANDDEVLWVPGCGMSQKIAVSEKATHRISLIRIGSDGSGLC